MHSCLGTYLKTRYISFAMPHDKHGVCVLNVSDIGYYYRVLYDNKTYPSKQYNGCYYYTHSNCYYT